MADLQGATNFGSQFVKQYYTVFDSNRAQLASLFCDVSIMSFESPTPIMGAQNIMTKLTNLPFKQVQHSITTIDSQPTVDGGFMVFVIGQLKTDDDPPHAFSEVFHVKQSGGNPIILNSFFRLSIHNIPS